VEGRLGGPLGADWFCDGGGVARDEEEEEGNGGGCGRAACVGMSLCGTAKERGCRGKVMEAAAAPWLRSVYFPISQ
jgi:hypothetical protein